MGVSIYFSIFGAGIYGSEYLFEYIGSMYVREYK